jgi:drug/metabolite transporter (DMT)-like permease
MDTKSIGNIGQWLGMLALVAGVVCMIVKQEALGSTIVAVASLVYAVTTKVKYYSGRRKPRRRYSIEELVSYRGLTVRPLAARSSFKVGG